MYLDLKNLLKQGKDDIQGAGSGGSGIEFEDDYNEDAELALVLGISMEEQRQRHERVSRGTYSTAAVPETPTRFTRTFAPAARPMGIDKKSVNEGDRGRNFTTPPKVGASLLPSLLGSSAGILSLAHLLIMSEEEQIEFGKHISMLEITAIEKNMLARALVLSLEERDAVTQPPVAPSATVTSWIPPVLSSSCGTPDLPDFDHMSEEEQIAYAQYKSNLEFFDLKLAYKDAKTQIKHPGEDDADGQKKDQKS